MNICWRPLAFVLGLACLAPANDLKAEVDASPLPLKVVPAFSNVTFTGWSPESDDGAPTPLRPIVLTHAGDGSNRVFVATQRGVIHVFDNTEKPQNTRVFFDFQKKVVYDDKQNEEGLLGFAFHPRYKQTGEFFLYYTTTEEPQLSVISRFRVSSDNPDKADPNSEEVLLRIKQPFWNHNGGTLAFGPDGYLYIGLGDGGSARDPFGHGQNLKTLLGSILRIDVDHKDPGKNYAVPKDNPFVGRSDARPEIWAYGVRNIWRLSFDRKTGVCWAADVGQDIWEEINIIVKGGNYGWNLREGMHPFGANGVGPRPDLIEPIWEYHHDIGKSITGGVVYRGKAIPELQGHFLYADYVSGIFHALKYDEKAGRTVANRTLPKPPLAVMSFGEDQDGEVYILGSSTNGQSVFKLVKGK